MAIWKGNNLILRVLRGLVNHGPWDHLPCTNWDDPPSISRNLVGGFNPSEKNACQIGSFPQIGLETKNHWNHHPEKNVLNLLNIWKFSNQPPSFPTKLTSLEPPLRNNRHDFLGTRGVGKLPRPEIRPNIEGLWKPIVFSSIRPKIRPLFLVGVVLMGVR